MRLSSRGHRLHKGHHSIMARKPAKSKTKAAPKNPKKPPGPAQYLKLLKGLKGHEGDFGFFDELDFNPTIDEWISTGVFGVDKLIGGGWPIGAVSECAGWEHVGKSTLIDQSMAMCQRMGGVAGLIDSDHARDAKWTKRMGVNLSELLTYNGDTVEECFDGFDAFLDIQERIIKELNPPKSKKRVRPKPMLLVWDALGGTQTEAEKKGKAGDSHVGVAARLVKQNLRRLTPRLKTLRVAIVIVNHMYQTIGPFATVRSYGGSGIRFHSHVRIQLAHKGQIKMGDRLVGNVTKVTSKKNRIIGVQPPIEIGLVYEAGIANSYTLFQWGLQTDIVEDQRWIVQSGAWYWLFPPGKEPISFQHGFLGLGQLLDSNPEIYQTMRDAYLGILV